MCSSYLAERDQESAEVPGGVADDGILQLFSVLWKQSVCALDQEYETWLNVFNNIKKGGTNKQLLGQNVR